MLNDERQVTLAQMVNKCSADYLETTSLADLADMILTARARLSHKLFRTISV